ncbi:hypothetical protein L1987_42959 [Smallanthus sonchifolius]|uniref:Uncharacterized protein n=1 Tax=Smallanthus sonchifolius TaxID=185202 RepID=A0ACB9GK83_9ASTR|nr:hypothetical protein L1987_42959 [Smallanthus sonchifolius]
MLVQRHEKKQEVEHYKKGNVEQIEALERKWESIPKFEKSVTEQYEERAIMVESTTPIAKKVMTLKIFSESKLEKISSLYTSLINKRKGLMLKEVILSDYLVHQEKEQRLETLTVILPQYADPLDAERNTRLLQPFTRMYFDSENEELVVERGNQEPIGVYDPS